MMETTSSIWSVLSADPESYAKFEITDITLYPEDRPCSAPIAKRILELFKDVTRHYLIDGEGHLVKRFSPTLTTKQLQLLDLLGISADRYR
jgi:hypothetical protein